MSWDSYVNNMLVNYQDQGGNVANNNLSEAYIIAKESGAVCASFPKMQVMNPSEFKSIQDFFQNKYGSVTLNGKKYLRKKLII